MQEPVAALFDINTDDISIAATNPESTSAAVAVGINTEGIIIDESNTEPNNTDYISTVATNPESTSAAVAVGTNNEGIIIDESNTELNNEDESLVGDFQRLSVSGPQTNEISDIDRATHSTVTLSRWQTKLRRISSYMLVREKKSSLKKKQFSYN